MYCELQRGICVPAEQRITLWPWLLGAAAVLWVLDVTRQMGLWADARRRMGWRWRSGKRAPETAL